VGDTVRFEL
jgi:integrase